MNERMTGWEGGLGGWMVCCEEKVRKYWMGGMIIIE